MMYLLCQVEAPDKELVDRITERLISKVYSKPYNEYVNDDDAMATDFADDVRKKIAFYDMCKDAQKPGVQEHNKQNYLFKYYEECQKANVHALPLFEKIKDNRLDLTGKFVNEAVCKAFAEAVKLHPSVLSEIVLEDN